MFLVGFIVYLLFGTSVNFVKTENEISHSIRNVRAVEKSPTCVLPEQPKNGFWFLPGGVGSPGKTVSEGTVLTVTCSPGYSHNGTSSESVCVDGEWSKNLECKRSCKPLISSISTQVQCFNNGAWSNCDHPVHGTALTITCAPFYVDPSPETHYCVEGLWYPYISRCQAICGRKRASVTSSIRGNYPWHATLYKNVSGKFEQTCGATLISSIMIMTASRCVVDDDLESKPEMYYIAVGNYYRQFKHAKDTNAQYSKLALIIPSSDFKGSSKNYYSDIAILILETPIIFTETVQPVCIDYENKIDIRQNQVASLLGWGSSYPHGGPSETLKDVYVGYSAESSCRQGLPTDFRPYFTSDKFCGHNINTSNIVCQGDEGGGLFFKDNDVYYIKGVASIQPLINNTCDPLQYSLYTNINNFISFVGSTISRYRKVENRIPPNVGTQDNRGKFNESNIPLKSCLLPKQPDQGKWELKYQSSQRYGDYVISGTVINATCNPGYALEELSDFALCNEGNWTNTFTCKRKCPVRRSTEVTTFSCTYNDFQRDCDKAIVGTFMEVVCSNFHEVKGGDVFRFCRDDGSWGNHVPQCVPVCGQKRGDAQLLGIGSTPVNIGDYPWQVAIFRKMNSEFAPQCGGSLITTKLVLTAAHCMVNDNSDGTITFNSDDYEVAVGKYYREYNDPKDTNAQYSKLRNIIINEQYRGFFGNYQGDVALLVVQKEFVLSAAVQPVCLDFSGIVNLKGGEVGVVPGWGYTKQGGSPSDVLRELEVPYVEENLCRSKLPDAYVQKYFTYDKICAGYHNSSKALCEGDSGGGLVFKQSDGRYYLRGVVSISPRNAGSCDIQQYTLFTNVLKFSPLISKTINRYS